jgi:CBS-domain-containing membrane protein
MKIEDIMTKTVRTCAASDTLSRAAYLMWEGDCGFLPVVDERHRPLGVVTDRDICMGAHFQGAPLDAARVESVMSRELFCCTPEQEVNEVEHLMQHAKVRRVPVVDVWGHVIGIVTLSDLARRAWPNLRKPQEGAAVALTLAIIAEPRHPGDTTRPESTPVPPRDAGLPHHAANPPW